ncbi:MAG: RNA polymerase sigma factor [bacterium]
MEIDNQELLSQAKQGSESAFESLVMRYQKTVYFAAYRLTHNHADADDILQETFIRLFNALQKETEIENLVAWLYRTAVNQAIDKLRQTNREKTTSLEIASAETEETFQMSLPDKKNIAPDEEVAEQERTTIIRKAIDSLSLQAKTITILHDLEGLKIKEIAAILDCAEGTVKATLYQSHRKLRQKLLPLMIELRGESAAKIEVESKGKYSTKSKQKELQHTNVKRLLLFLITVIGFMIWL